MDLINQKIYKLTIQDIIRKNGRLYCWCKCDCGNLKIISKHSILCGDTKSCGCIKGLSRIKDLTGQRFGRLTVVKQSYRKQMGLRKKIFWECQCDCGKIKSILGTTLFKNTKSCGCLAKENCIRNRKGFMDINTDFWYTVKRGAKTRNLIFDITKEQVWDLFKNQDYKCYLSGENINFAYRFGEVQTASIDRIDCRLGYTIDNIRIVHKDLNRMRSNIDNDIFMNLIYYIQNKYEDGECFPFKKGPQYNGYNDIPYWYIRHVRYHAKGKNRLLDLNTKYLWELLVKQNYRCPYTGLILNFCSDQRQMKSTNISLDRIDSDKGYIEDNVQWTHKIVNKMKSNFQEDEFLSWCHKIYNNLQLKESVWLM